MAMIFTHDTAIASAIMADSSIIVDTGQDYKNEYEYGDDFVKSLGKKIDWEDERRQLDIWYENPYTVISALNSRYVFCQDDLGFCFAVDNGDRASRLDYRFLALDLEVAATKLANQIVLSLDFFGDTDEIVKELAESIMDSWNATVTQMRSRFEESEKHLKDIRKAELAKAKGG